MTPKKKLFIQVLATLLAAALSPVVVGNLWGYVYGRLIQGKGGAMAEFYIGWVAGLWLGGAILVVGLAFSFIQYRKS